jgi:hypothetical protein
MQAKSCKLSIPKLYSQISKSFHIDTSQAQKYESVRSWEARLIWETWKLRKEEKVLFT